MTPEEQLASLPDWVRNQTEFVPVDPHPHGRGFLALTGAIIWPGLGHLFSGNYRRGAFWFIVGTVSLSQTVASILTPLVPSAILLISALAILIQIVQMLDASRCARESTKPMLTEPVARYAVGVALLFASVIWQQSTHAYLHINWLQGCFTPTPSMSPTLNLGDRFLCAKDQPIKRWDIVVFISPTDPNVQFVKRIVGLPGERVEITGDGITINGSIVNPPDGVGPYQPLDTNYVPLSDSEPGTAATGCWGNPVTLKQDEYFALGDNTAVSDDSRFWAPYQGHQAGALPADQITGKVIAIYWPQDRWRVLN